VLAVIDTTFLAASVRDARANVLKAQSQYDKTLRDHDRATDMFDRGLVSEAELEDALTTMMSARGTLLSAEASLQRSLVNLEYAVIRSPIDGTVIMRSVEAGQTVAASLSSPTLFVIAEDLRDMEIHALVDESDIGYIREGMPATFTVEAHLDREFDAVVRQVWLQPETIQNVVNYTVVLDARNDDGILYPGMTATIDFVVDEVHDVLLVPSAALRLKATPSMFAEMRDQMVAQMTDEERAAMQKRIAARAAEAGRSSQGGTSGGSGAGASYGGASASGGFPGGGFGQTEEGTGRLWYLDDKGKLNIVTVETGVTDGRHTEIKDGDRIREGMQVITSVEEPEQDANVSNNPLSQTFGRRH
jgi:RND family efflux transporter MFP subunit